MTMRAAPGTELSMTVARQSYKALGEMCVVWRACLKEPCCVRMPESAPSNQKGPHRRPFCIELRVLPWGVGLGHETQAVAVVCPTTEGGARGEVGGRPGGEYQHPSIHRERPRGRTRPRGAIWWQEGGWGVGGGRMVAGEGQFVKVGSTKPTGLVDGQPKDQPKQNFWLERGAAARRRGGSVV